MIEVLIGVTAFILGMIYIRSWRPRNLPPGPSGLPIVGNILEFDKDPPFKKFMEWRKTYGDTILVHMGNRYPMVVMHDYDIAKAAFSDEATTGRDQRLICNPFFQEQGLIASQGELWKEHRRFAISTLRDFGMGKSWMETNILAEIEDMCGVLRKQNKQPFDPKTLLSHAVSNIVCALVFGQRFAHSDAQFTKLAALFAGRNVRNTGLMSQSRKFVPERFRRSIENAWKCCTLLAVTSQNIHELFGFAKQLIEEHKGRFSSENVIDYIDAFMKEAEEQQRKGTVTTFTDKQLVTSVLNLFAAGTESTSMTIVWAFLFLLENPKILHTMQKEIDDNIPRDQPVRMDDKGLVPYNEATILEAQRFASLIPLGIPHQAMTDTVIGGYNVPKGTVLVPNLYSMHHDPRYWKNPYKFDPCHFLDTHGKVVIPPGFAPFQVGKRSCPGEALAKMELYLFITNIVKNFDLLNAPGQSVSHADHVASIVLAPFPYKIVFVPR